MHFLFQCFSVKAAWSDELFPSVCVQIDVFEQQLYNISKIDCMERYLNEVMLSEVLSMLSWALVFTHFQFLAGYI